MSRIHFFALLALALTAAVTAQKSDDVVELDEAASARSQLRGGTTEDRQLWGWGGSDSADEEEDTNSPTKSPTETPTKSPTKRPTDWWSNIAGGAEDAWKEVEDFAKDPVGIINKEITQGACDVIMSLGVTIPGVRVPLPTITGSWGFQMSGTSVHSGSVRITSCRANGNTVSIRMASSVSLSGGSVQMPWGLGSFTPSASASYEVEGNADICKSPFPTGMRNFRVSDVDVGSVSIGGSSGGWIETMVNYVFASPVKGYMLNIVNNDQIPRILGTSFGC